MVNSINIVPVLAFIHIDFLDILDIFLVAWLLYQLYHIVKGTLAIRIFMGLFGIYLFWKIVEALNMELLSEILGQFIGVGVILLIIVFQQELRKFLLMLGNTDFINNRIFKQNLFHFGAREQNKLTINTKIIAEACINMAKIKTGALIVISHSPDIDFYIGSGEILNARLSSSLLESIFFKNAPMHDGAVLIRNNTVLAASCVLPVSDKEDLPSDLGTRHRAALGVSEETSAIAITVSEETGRIGTTKSGILKQNITPANLNAHLQMLLK